MKKIAIILLATLLPMMASALAFTVNGLSYEHLGGLNDGVRLLGFVGEKCPSEVIIPATVTNDGRTYSVEVISSGAFLGSKDLVSVEMKSQDKNGVRYIEPNSFAGCTSLSKVTFSGRLEGILAPGFSGQLGAFEGCTALESIDLPASMDYKGEIDATATHNICKWAFKNCSNLEKIIIRAQKPYIEDEAFLNCSSLQYFVSYNTQPWNLESNTFQGIPSSATLIVPDGTKSSYQGLSGWNAFNNVSEHSSVDLNAIIGGGDQPQDGGSAKLTIEDFTIKAGETKTMLIDMQNPDDQVTLVQFDLRLPDGLSIASGDDAIDIAGRTTWKKHTLTSNAIDGITRILLYSSTNAVIDGTSGAIISIKLSASSSFNGGDIKLENQLMTTPSLVESKPATYTYNIKGGGDNPPVDSPLEMTFKVLNAVNGVVYSKIPYTKLTYKNVSEEEFKGDEWCYCYKQLGNGEWSDKIYCGSSMKITLKPEKSGFISSKWTYPPFEDGFYKWEWGYEDENGNSVNIGSLIMEIKGNDRYKAIVLNDDDMMTYCDEDDLDFSHVEGLKAFIATDINAATSEIKMQKVNDAPAGTGLLLVGQPGCYLAERTSSTSTFESNMLIGVLDNTIKLEPVTDGFTNYIFNESSQKFIIAGNMGISIVYQNMAYLRVPTQDAGDIQAVTPVFSSSTPLEVGKYFVIDNMYYTVTSSSTVSCVDVWEGKPSSVTIPETVEGNILDWDTNKYDGVYVGPYTVTGLGDGYVRDNWNSVKSLILANTITSIDDYLCNVGFESLESIVMPKKLTHLKSSFSYMEYLKNVTFPSNSELEVIDDGAFWDCKSLEEIQIPASVTTLGKRVFYGCTSLASVTFTNDVPSNINSNCFEGVGTASVPATLEVPEQFKSNYQAKFNGNMFYGGYFTLKGVTGVNSIVSENQPQDVYSLNGTLLKKGATSLKSLSKGIYLVNGRKVVVR